MTTWDEVVVHLSATYSVGEISEDRVEIWWRFREGSFAIQQRQSIRLLTAFDEPWLIISADVSALALTEPLRHNATLAIGAIAEENDSLVVRAQLALADVSLERLDRALFLIAHEAARLALTAPRAAIVTSAIAHFAD